MGLKRYKSFSAKLSDGARGLVPSSLPEDAGLRWPSRLLSVNDVVEGKEFVLENCRGLVTLTGRLGAPKCECAVADEVAATKLDSTVDCLAWRLNNFSLSDSLEAR